MATSTSHPGLKSPVGVSTPVIQLMERRHTHTLRRNVTLAEAEIQRDAAVLGQLPAECVELRKALDAAYTKLSALMLRHQPSRRLARPAQKCGQDQ
jgi:hypothetical protein